MRAKAGAPWAGLCVALALMASAAPWSIASPVPQAACQKIVLWGEVSAGQEWKAGFGQGWVFRVLPIDSAKTPPGQASYSGWDLVVDREQPAGFPDALLMATPPYESINEREVGTTFGLRAQDSIGWNPRSFGFLTSPVAFRESQQLYQHMNRNGPSGSMATGRSTGGSATADGSQVTRRLMELLRQSSSGQFRILDARLTPGIADAAPFAENWATQSARTPHSVEAASGDNSTPLGTLGWMRFSITLWLPGTWQAPAALHAVRGACSE